MNQLELNKARAEIMLGAMYDENGRCVNVEHKQFIMMGWIKDDNPKWAFHICDYRLIPEVIEPEYRPYSKVDEAWLGKAIKIAEFEGWKLKIDSVQSEFYHKPLEFRGYCKGKEVHSIGSASMYYSSYDGLMPIVERVNNDAADKNYIKILLADVRVYYNCEYDFKAFDYGNTNPLIDALQNAIIFYHENKEIDGSKT